jgi:hypothetical protein
MPTAAQLPKISPAQFYAQYRVEIDAAVAEIGCKLNDLLCVMHFETAGTLSPAVENPYSKAVGLIQFTKGAATDIGTTRAKLAKMTVAQQLRYVVAYFKLPNRRPPYSEVGDLYLSVFYPAARRYTDYQVVISQSNAPQTYANNRGLDKNQDGNIYKHEITARIRQHYQTYFSQQSNLPDNVPTVPETDKPQLNDTAASAAQTGKVLDGDYNSSKKKRSSSLAYSLPPQQSQHTSTTETEKINQQKKRSK